MADRHTFGVLDTSTYIDLDLLDPWLLPEVSELTAVTMAELYKGITPAKDATTRDVRTKRLGVAIVDFEPLPFDRRVAARYGSMVGLMVAATASCHDLPLYTRNAKDFVGLESLVEVIEV
ncbi:type II toxin-antitoxin system VapC family toxin [Saccharothrix sp. NRRL B-16314]|uniref:type II toxin-antitoxin system VapC family toxin n=1 Tax=Saccharothrix sp. NRRL B-16314 TaxID=1463825 RepID=UPI000525A66A|nr:type II toxin-antitoxin system VapC family toxin [Saccharothrix sp. NRRL B-16314]